MYGHQLFRVVVYAPKIMGFHIPQGLGYKGCIGLGFGLEGLRDCSLQFSVVCVEQRAPRLLWFDLLKDFGVQNYSEASASGHRVHSYLIPAPTIRY